MLELWSPMLERTNATNLSFQSTTMDLCTASKLLQSLKDFFSDDIRPAFTTFEEKAKQRCEGNGYRGERKRQRNILTSDREVAADKRPSYQGKYFGPRHSYQLLITLYESFKWTAAGIFSHCGSIWILNTYRTNAIVRYENEVLLLVKAYPDDLEEDLVQEAVQLRSYLADRPQKSMVSQYQMLWQDGIAATFPNVEIAMRIFLSLMSTNCEGERSFSQMKRINNCLGYTLGQSKLSDLGLLTIEHDLARKLQSHDIINDFALLKSRKMCLI